MCGLFGVGLQKNGGGGVKCKKTWGECARKEVELLGLEQA